MSYEEMMKKVRTGDGFLAALDQSGGSTPKALKAYGVPDNEYEEGKQSMYDQVHRMRQRIMTSERFSGDKVLGAILFEHTMDHEVEGRPTGEYLWEVKKIVPFIKVDKGLEKEENGVQLMKEIPNLEELLRKGKEKKMFGTKMRSVIKSADDAGIKAIVDQQFEIADKILKAGLCPIIEPEVDINSLSKKDCEHILKKYLLQHLDKLGENDKVMLKLTLPSEDNFYQECIKHPNVVRVVALSGGYPRSHANEILARQNGMIASFSRALIEDLNYNMSESEFDASLGKAVDSIFDASKAG
jgi:fructose-bisphosphate aldolase class I